MKKITNKEQKDQALKSYQAIQVPAKEARKAIEAQAWEAYQAIEVSAWKAYEAKCKEIDKQGHIKIIDGKRYKLMEEE